MRRRFSAISPALPRYAACGVGDRPQILRRSRVPWNDAKISAHHAIIPTTVPVNLARLTAMERNIYELIARAYIAQFCPNYVYDQTKAEVTHHGETFTARGRTERTAGWRTMYRTGKNESEDAEKEDEESAVLRR